MQPYLTYYNVFYLFVFSMIKHKELRFLLPIVPFAFIMAGELLEQTIKQSNRWAIRSVRWIKRFIVIEIVSFILIVTYHHRLWEWEHYLVTEKATAENPIHSVYSMDRYGSPHYSWFHGQNT